MLTGQLPPHHPPRRRRGRNRAVDQAVVRAKQGDREALRYLYVHYADHVYGYVASIVRDDHEAEDVTQHVFAKLMTALPKYEPREVPFSAWILRVARNVAVDHMRQRRAIPCDEVRELETRTDDDDASRHALASGCATRSPRSPRSSARSSSCATSSG